MDETPREATTPDPSEPLPEPPRGVLPALDELLRSPARLSARAERRETAVLLRILAGALLCFVVYGVASGFFQGGFQIMVTALKVPLIIVASLLLCLPSLYVLAGLAGVEVSPRWLTASIVGIVGMLGLLLVALMPVAWLFSVSSGSLGFLVFLHFFVWLIAVAFAYRFLAVAARNRGSGALVLWTMLFVLVSFQVASQMRPVLWRPDGMALFAPRKMFFLEHLGRVLDERRDDAASAASD